MKSSQLHHQPREAAWRLANGDYRCREGGEGKRLCYQPSLQVRCSQGPGGGAEAGRAGPVLKPVIAPRTPADPPGRERSFHKRPASPGGGVTPGGGHIRASPRQPAVRPSFPRLLSFPGCVRAAASSPASPPADISKSSRPVSTSLFPASSSSPGAGPLASGHPGNSFIQRRWGLLGYFGCKLGAGCGVGSAERRALGSPLARGQQGRQSRPDRIRKGRRPHVATGSRTDPRALPADARLWPAPPRESEIPREQSSRPGHLGASGFGAGARARVVTAAVSGLTLRPGTAPQGDPTRGAESPAGAGPRQKPGL